MNDLVFKRAGRSDMPFVVVAIVALSLLLFFGRSMTFWFDDWDFLTFSGAFVDYLHPHNEHWSTLPLVLYRLTFHVVHLDSYLPYLAEVVVLHVIAVTGAYVLVRRRLGTLWATVLVLPLLFLGAGSENLFWAFQTGFVGSTMFGIWALVLVEQRSRRAAVVAAVLLLAALMSSGIGLVFVTAVIVRTSLDDANRRRVLVVLPGLIVYSIWFATLGRGVVGEAGDLAGPAALVLFLARGVRYSVSELTGLDFSREARFIAFLLFLGLAFSTLRALIAGRSRPLAAAGVVGVVALYTIVGIARAELESDYETRSRFVYVVAFFLVLAVADLLPRSAGRLHLPHSRVGLSAMGFIAIALVASIAANLVALDETQDRFRYQADMTRAYVGLAIKHRGESWIDPDGFWLAPDVPSLLATVSEYGSPLRDAMFPGVVPAIGLAAREEALVLMVGRGFRVDDALPDGSFEHPVIVGTTGLADTRKGRCLGATSTDARGTLVLSVAGGRRVRLTTRAATKGSVSLSRNWPAARFVDLDLPAGRPRDVVVPDVGDGQKWRLGFDFDFDLEPSGDARNRLTVCVVKPES